MANNITLMQFFHWYIPADGTLWNHFGDEAAHLAKLGITGVWLPPAYKGASGGYDVGYSIYDLFDLGEFDQKGTVRTKYGTKAEYIKAIKNAHKEGIQVLGDVVFNHKAGADEKERFPVRKVNTENRTEFVSEVFDIESYTKFTFPGRKGKYSTFIWDWHCFTGVDSAEGSDEKAIYSIQNEYGEGWEDLIEEELGNYDFLMADDVEYRNPAVREEVKKWGLWYLKQTDVDGFRLDAVKHINPDFMAEWVKYMKENSPKPLFVVGEYWNTESAEVLQKYIDRTEGQIQLFDTILHMHFHHASLQKNDYDLRTIFDGTLVQTNPLFAVTLVDNHDTQPLQSLESPVDFWFKPLAYAMILLREHGIPCIFYPALYGAKYSDKGQDGNDHEVNLAALAELQHFLPLRKTHSYGIQRDFMDHQNTIGWTREGDDEHPGSGLAVLLSNGEEGFKKMEIGTRHAGKSFVDRLGYRKETVTVDENGWGEFYCNAGSVSVWVVSS
jgi:alpha-amylase